MPFPRLLRWALLAPLAGFALAMLLPALLSVLLPGDILKSASVLLLALSALVELLALPVAVFLLVRGDPYVTTGNVVTTLFAALPVAFAVAVVLVLRYGHFHI